MENNQKKIVCVCVCVCVYSAYKLNNQDDNIQPWHTLFPIWNQSVVPCPGLFIVYWTADRFHRMYSVYKLNKQGENVQPSCTPFPIWIQSIVPCPVLTVAFWPAYRFLRRQVRWSGIPVSLRIFQSLLWSTPWTALA